MLTAHPFLLNKKACCNEWRREKHKLLPVTVRSRERESADHKRIR